MQNPFQNLSRERKITIAILALSIFLVAGTAIAADLNWTDDTNVIIDGNPYVILADSGATTFEVGDMSATVTVASGSTFTIRSNDKFRLDNDKDISQTCNSSSNTLTIKGPKTVIITPDATKTCVQTSSGGSAALPATPAVPAGSILPSDCLPGYNFSPLTGESCNMATPAAPAVPATPATHCEITLTLRQGSNGDQVKCLQTNLSISSDGIFGPKTKAAVILFQKAKGLVPDGIVGPKTKAMLI